MKVTTVIEIIDIDYGLNHKYTVSPSIPIYIFTLPGTGKTHPICYSDISLQIIYSSTLHIVILLAYIDYIWYIIITMDQNIEKIKSSTYDPKLYTEEAKRARFKRIAERRINKVLEALRLIGNVGNKSLYSYTDEEIEKMFDALENKIRETKSKFKLKRSEGYFRF